MYQKKIDIPVLYGTFADLTKFDLTFINGKVVRHTGPNFKKFIKLILPSEEFASAFPELMKNYENENLYEGDKIWSYAIIPIDLDKPFESKNWYHFFQLMLSIFPSDLTIIKTINLEYSGGKYGFRSLYTNRFTPSGKENFDNFMFIAPSEYVFVRNYLKRYFNSSLNLKYLKYILTTYANALRENSSIYQYLSLIICLEVTVEGTEQLTYRLKRNIALLCGKDLNSCERIYSNVDQLYKLRSAIVHGQIEPSYKNFQEYNDYLKTLVARLIRELVTHNISTINELNKKITSIGYGQNNLISANYRPSKHPTLDNIRLSFKTIQKY